MYDQVWVYMLIGSGIPGLRYVLETFSPHTEGKFTYEVPLDFGNTLLRFPTQGSLYTHRLLRHHETSNPTLPEVEDPSLMRPGFPNIVDHQPTIVEVGAELRKIIDSLEKNRN